MAKVDFDFYRRLKRDGRVASKLPKIISSSDDFQTLLGAKIIEKVPSGRGYYYSVSKVERFYDFYNERFPQGDIEVETEIDNQLKYRDTKATALKKERVVFIRSFDDVEVNSKRINLTQAMDDFNIFSTVLESLKAKKICFVENLHTFLEVEKLLGREYTYIHFYGRLARREILQKIECHEYLHFGDYDFVGLLEFIKASEVFKNCKLYIPENYDELYRKFSRPREKKDTAFKEVKNSTIAEVVKIRKQLESSNRFLEQQVVLSSVL